MSRRVIPGGFYGDSLPSGQFAVTMLGQGVVIHTGEVLPMPFGTNLLYTVISPDGVHIAGVANDGPMRDHAVEWDGHQWLDRDLAFGPDACIYDAAGVLHIVRGPNTLTGSQGWRAEGVTCDATHYDAAKDLSDYTPLGPDLAIGQSHDNNRDDAIAWIDGVRRDMEPGPCRLQRHRLANGIVSSVLVNLVSGNVILLWHSRAELAALPLAVTVPPIVIPKPPPVEPKPTMKIPANVQTIIAAFVAKFPVPTGPNPADEAFENVMRAYVKRIAEYVQFGTQDARWGVKDAGGGRPQGKDAIAYNSQAGLLIWDYFGGTGTGRPQINLNADSIPLPEAAQQHFIPVQAIDHVGVTVPPPDDLPPVDPPADDPGDTNGSALIVALLQITWKQDEEIAALKAIQDGLAQQNAAIVAGLADLKKQIAGGIRVRL